MAEAGTSGCGPTGSGARPTGSSSPSSAGTPPSTASRKPSKKTGMTDMSNTTTQKPASAPTLTVERVFNATPERLWSYWTDPAKYAKWLNPAPGMDLVIHEWEARAGGKVRFDMPQPNGDRNPQEGGFHRLSPYTEIVSGSPDKPFLITVRLA